MRVRVGLDAPVNKGYFKLLKAADGSEIFLITGALRVSFTNLQTGKTLIENVSGPGHLTANPDGSATVVARGRGFTFLMCEDARRLGMPVMFVYGGVLTEQVTADGTVTSVSMQGDVQVDVCAALS